MFSASTHSPGLYTQPGSGLCEQSCLVGKGGLLWHELFGVTFQCSSEESAGLDAMLDATLIRQRVNVAYPGSLAHLALSLAMLRVCF